MTGTLTVRYRRADRAGGPPRRGAHRPGRGLQDLTVGTISDAEGVTVEAEGVFILPTWARAHRREPGPITPIRYE